MSTKYRCPKCGKIFDCEPTNCDGCGAILTVRNTIRDESNLPNRTEIPNKAATPSFQINPENSQNPPVYCHDPGTLQKALNRILRMRRCVWVLAGFSAVVCFIEGVKLSSIYSDAYSTGQATAIAELYYRGIGAVIALAFPLVIIMIALAIDQLLTMRAESIQDRMVDVTNTKRYVHKL